MLRGTVVSFDRVKGYGFVAPDSGGEDVFVHVNDVLDDKGLLASGSQVEFLVEDGERGPKASSVIVVSAAAPASSGVRHAKADPDGEEMCDVLSAGEFRQEVSELLLRGEPTLTGAQILNLRARIVELAQTHGWVDR